MKEKAIKAGILLAVGLFVCILVSRMVIYMTAPKAQFISFEQTYIFNEYTHKGMLEYGTYQNMFFKDAMKRPLQITDIHVKQGDSVEKGDILFTFQLFQDVQMEKTALEKELRTLARSKEAMYETLLKAKVNLTSREVKLAQEYVEINTRMPVVKKIIEDSLPENIKADILSDEKALQQLIQNKNVSKDLIDYIKEFLLLNGQLNKIQPSLEAELKWGQNTDYKMALQWYELLADIEGTAQKIADLAKLEKQPLTYKAAVKGRVTTVNASIGDMYNGTTPLYAITTNEFPVITIPKTEVSLDDSYISNDYTIKYNDKIYECKVKNIEDGKLVLVPSSALFDADTLENLLGNSFTVQSTTQKVVYETTLPISAVHRRLNKDYIYIVKKQKGFWEDEYRVEEMEVEILSYNDFFAAVSAHLEEGNIILDKWDRTMSAGQRVYEFAK